jgi:hypothetical protein
MMSSRASATRPPAFECIIVSVPDFVGKISLLLDREHIDFADVLEVLVQRGAFSIRDPVCNLELPHTLIPS